MFISEETEQYWCYQRYELITEFNRKPPLIPPFVFATYGYKLAKSWLNSTPFTGYDHGGYRLSSEITLEPVDDAEIRMWLATQREEILVDIHENAKNKSVAGGDDDS